MKRYAFVLIVFFAIRGVILGQVPTQTEKDDLWYSQALRHINPDNIDYGSIWEQRKRAILHQIGNPYFQYSFATTAAVVALLTLLCIQRVSHKRALDIAALSIADVLRHDEYSRQIANEAIRKHNEHIESCNRSIEAGQDREAELQRVRKELADTQAENRSLRNQQANTQKSIVGTTPPKKAEHSPASDKKKESEPGHLAARIASLEKRVREEQRRNQNTKGTSVDDHRA